MDKLREARINLEKALRMFREGFDQEGEAVALGYLGLVYQDQHNLSQALRASWRAHNIHRDACNAKGTAEQLVRLALIYRDEGDHDKALDLLEKAQQEYLDNPDDLGQARLYATRGLAHRDLGDLHKALRDLSEAHEIFQRETGDPKEEANVKSEIAAVRHELGESSGGPPLEELRSALELHQRIGYRKGEAVTHGYMGRILLDEGELEDALVESTKALHLHEQSGDDKGMAAMHEQVGRIHLKGGSLDEAEASLKKAMDLYTTIHDVRGEGSVLVYLGMTKFHQNEVKEAKRLWERGYRLSLKTQSPRTQSLHLACMGWALLCKGMQEEGLRKLSEATRIGRDALARTEAVDLISGRWSAEARSGRAVCDQAMCLTAEQLCNTLKAHDGLPRDIAKKICATGESQPSSGTSRESEQNSLGRHQPGGKVKDQLRARNRQLEETLARLRKIIDEQAEGFPQQSP
jgi:tetratricopeptide (TPR) repeat protein